MQKQFVVLFLVIFLLQLSPNNNLFAQTWETHTCKNDVQDLTIAGDYCWAATTGGVVKININDFTFEEFGKNTGLSSNISSAVTVDSTNKIWIGTKENNMTVISNTGIAYYDINTNNLSYNNSVNCLLVDKENNVWAGTKGGTFIFKDSVPQLLDKNNSEVLSDYVYTIKQNKDKKIWFGSTWGVMIFDGMSWEFYNKSNSDLQSNLISDLDFEDENKIWLATLDNGVYCYNNGLWQNYNSENSGLKENKFTSAFVDSKNNKWFGSVYGRIYCFKDNTWQAFDSTNTILPFDSTFTERYASEPKAQVNAITEDGNGNIWAGTANGLYIYNGIEWKQIIISGLQSNYIASITLDPQKNVWLGTGNGVTEITPDGFITYNSSNSNLTQQTVSNIAVDISGRVWAADWYNGVSVLDQGVWLNYSQTNGSLPDNAIFGIAAEDSNTVWLGTRGKGIIKYDGNEFTITQGENTILNSTTVWAIGIDQQKNKWIGTNDLFTGINRGLICFDGVNWKQFNTSNSGIASNNVEAIAIEDNGAIWIGTTKGVSCYNGGQWVTYTQSNSGLVQDYIVNIAIDHKGRKWFGSYEDGLSMLDGEIWTTFNKSNSMIAGNYITALAEDTDGRILIGTENGLSIYDDNTTGIKQISLTKTPDQIVLYQNYPNPFNADTKIKYSIKSNGQVKLNVYNLRGQLVQTLYNGYNQPGEHSAHWNGLDAAGNSAASGVYFYRLLVNEQVIETKRLVLLK